MGPKSKAYFQLLGLTLDYKTISLYAPREGPFGLNPRSILLQTGDRRKDASRESFLGV